MAKNFEPSLFLIPNFLDDGTAPERVLPPYNLEVVKNLRYYIAEHEKSARRFIKKILPEVPQNELHFTELNKHTVETDISHFLEPLKHGHSVGLISDAGMPAIADPGAIIVAEAHRQKIPVVPLVGPSSLFLALAASGLNGQHFEFHGYLPVKIPELTKKIRRLEKESRAQKKTQIFIETPYRNERMLQILLKHLSPTTRLSIAVELTGENQEITTAAVKDWRNRKIVLRKRPAVFLFQSV